MENKIHRDPKVKRFREMLGLKQEILARRGLDKVSLVEQKEILDTALLQRIFDVLKIPVDVYKNFDEESALNIISYIFNNHEHSTPQLVRTINNSENFNPIDKLVELYERIISKKKKKIDKLLEKRQLYSPICTDGNPVPGIDQRDGQQ